MSKEHIGPGDELPFSEKGQQAVLGHLLRNDQFALQAVHRIKPEWFHDPVDQKIWGCRVKFYQQHKRAPKSLDEFLEMPEISCEEQVLKNRIFSRIKLCEHEVQFFPLDGLVPRLTKWMQSQAYCRAIEESARQYNTGQVDESFSTIREGISKLDDIRFDEGDEASFERMDTLFLEAETELEGALTFGNPHIDKIIMPDAKIGSLLRGDTTVLLAPTNVGKTTTMITVIRHNIFAHKDVLFLTHEGRQSDIMQKLIQSMLRMTRPEMFRAYHEDDKKKLFERVAKYFKDHLCYIALNKAGMNVEEVDSIIRRKIDEKKARTGRGFDLLVDDYPAKLFTLKAAKGHMARRHIDDIVYNYFVQWALEYKMHSLVAIQANREGSKINRRQKDDEQRLLSMEDVSEAWGPMTTATNVLTLNRDDRARRENRLVLNLCKSRSTETGIAIVTRSQYDRALTHAPWLPVSWYRGTSAMSDKLDDLLRQNENKPIPEHFWEA